jgi:hypothetical protein
MDLNSFLLAKTNYDAERHFVESSILDHLKRSLSPTVSTVSVEDYHEDTRMFRVRYTDYIKMSGSASFYASVLTVKAEDVFDKATSP